MRATFQSEDEDDDAPILGHRRRKLDPGDLDITPMIDVTFLLLIFFMVTSTMKEPATADVPPARHGVGTDASEALIVTVFRGEGGDIVQVDLPDGTRQTLEELEKSRSLTTLVKTAMESEPPKTDVILNADRDLTHGTVRAVSRMIGEVEGVRLFLGVRDK